MPKFTVDTHLFRELGELLVGRDSTALVELVKNAYDADATEVTLFGDNLDDRDRGVISIVDNGSGMTTEQFEQGFLRVASRAKEQGDRLSSRFRRRFTGAKGIGRLAAHKLARLLEIESVAWSNQTSSNDREAIDARIDWDAVEQYETLDDLDDTGAIRLQSRIVSTPTPHRTSITLRRLRRRWTPAERGRLLNEIQAFEPASVLTAPLSPSIVDSPLLFKQPVIRESRGADPGFRVLLEGDFAGGDDYWQVAAQAAEWIIEIDTRENTVASAKKTCQVHYAIAPTQLMRRKHASLEQTHYVIDHPDPTTGPFFQARVFVRSGQFPARGGAAEWARRAAGIRVFLEGFRVLPYGEPSNDWLQLDSDYTRRSRSLGLLPDLDVQRDGPKDINAPLSSLPNRDYFGAVFLTEEGASPLRMLVNREGFVPEAPFDTLVRLVRIGIDLSVRVRAAASEDERTQRREERIEAKGTDGDATTPVIVPLPEQALQASIRRASSLAQEARQLVVAGELPRAAETIRQAVAEVEGVAQFSDTLVDERAMLRVLASAGTQMAAFIHEINGLVGMVQAIDVSLARIREDPTLPARVRQELGKVHSSLGDLRRNIERQAAYLIDVVTPDARRRRSRQSLAERLDAGKRLVAIQAEKRGIVIQNDIPAALKSPPMFPAELTTAFSNLLSNAVKAAGLGGRIRAGAKQLGDGRIRLCIENTGAAVDLAEGERWFKPFQSTTADVDPVLGQGMGLGLPITRNMLEEYGAEIRFTRPSEGYSTAIEIIFPR